MLAYIYIYIYIYTLRVKLKLLSIERVTAVTCIGTSLKSILLLTTWYSDDSFIRSIFLPSYGRLISSLCITRRKALINTVFGVRILGIVLTREVLLGTLICSSIYIYTLCLIE